MLVLIPNKETYFETTSAVLGKMYSNTMMVLLNSRMVYGITDDTDSNKLSFVMAYITSQVGVSVAHEQQPDPLEHPLEMVSVTIQILISSLNFRL
jgi:hypothetical protein